MADFEMLYGVAGTVDFSIPAPDGVDLMTAITFAAGDVVLIKDGGTPANATNDPVHEGNGIWSWTYTAAEAQAKRMSLSMIDQTATKVWMDKVITIETYGNELSQHNRREPGVILATTIASVTDDANFTVTTKPNDNNTLLDCVAVIFDFTTPDAPPDRSRRMVTAYTGSTGAVQLASAADFTLAAGDYVLFLPAADVASAAEIVTALLAQVLALPGQEAPPLAPTVGEALTWPYKVLRNPKEQTEGSWSLMNDAGDTVDAKATTGDSAGVTTKTKIVSGP